MFIQEIVSSIKGFFNKCAVIIEYFEKICIPILNDNIQQKITCYIKQSKLLYNQSKILLEIAIEQNEDIALNYLQEQSDNILNNN